MSYYETLICGYNKLIKSHHTCAPVSLFLPIPQQQTDQTKTSLTSSQLCSSAAISSDPATTDWSNHTLGDVITLVLQCRSFSQSRYNKLIKPNPRWRHHNCAPVSLSSDPLLFLLWSLTTVLVTIHCRLESWLDATLWKKYSNLLYPYDVFFPLRSSAYIRTVIKTWNWCLELKPNDFHLFNKLHDSSVSRSRDLKGVRDAAPGTDLARQSRTG